MQHGDIQVQVSLRGEPHKLLTYWRGSLRETLPISAAVTIVRPKRNHGNRGYWDYRDPSFYFEAITRTEKKRAELSISDKSLLMQAGEIATARHLTEILSDWLSRRHGLPHLDQPIPNARIALRCEGDGELVGIVEKFGDPEVLSSAQVGAVYTQGEPRRPDIRWLPTISSTDKTVAIGELQTFEKSLADGQGADVRSLVNRIATVFRKQVVARRALLQRRFTEIFGMGAELEINDRPLTDKMIESYKYEEILIWLDEQGKENPKDGIRTWRG
jgi:hypothetical protein